MAPYLTRVNHCAFYFKNGLFLYGGELTLQPEQEEEEYNSTLCFTHFLRFSCLSKEWIKVPLNLPANHSLSCITRMGHTIQANLLYIFGGQNSVTQQFRPSELMVINLDTSSAKRLETKGTPPDPCINPNLLFLNKATIILYGGQTISKTTWRHEYANDIHIYKLDSRTWIKTEDNYKDKLPTLMSPFLLALTENQLYLFGGSREVALNDGDPTVVLTPNKELFKLKPISKITSPKPDVLIRKIFASN